MSRVIKLFTTSRISDISRRYLTNVTKDLSRHNDRLTPVVNQDILLSTLKSTTETRGILELVNAHVKVMNNKHLMQALRSLFVLQKNGDSDLSTRQILRHPDFDKLCQGLRKQSGTIDLNDTIEALKVLTFVGVSSDSQITQVLLQLLRQQINQLSLHQIIFLDFLLAQTRPTPMIDALLLALPMVFEIQLPIKLDLTNLAQICECLHYLSDKKGSRKAVEYLVDNLCRFGGEIDGKSAVSIIWSVCEMESDRYFDSILKKCFDALLIDIDSLTFEELETTLSKTLQKCSQKFPFYYNQVFADFCANQVIDQDLGFDNAIYILKKFNKVHHINNNLLEYATDKIVGNPSLFHDSAVTSLSILTSATALTDFRPRGWRDVATLLSRTEKFKTTKELYWAKVAASLTCLDVYKPEVLRMAFDQQFLDKIIKKGYNADLSNTLTAVQGVKLFRPELSHLLPAEAKTWEVFDRIVTSGQFPLEQPLQMGFGGDKYVKTNVVSSLYHRIDHVIVMRPGGFPVAFASFDSSNRLEEINNNPENQVVCILALSNLDYTRNDRRLKGTTSFTIRTLEAIGHTVVPICLDDWTALQDFEKIPYLVQAVNTKLSTNANLQFS